MVRVARTLGRIGGGFSVALGVAGAAFFWTLGSNTGSLLAYSVAVLAGIGGVALGVIAMRSAGRWESKVGEAEQRAFEKKLRKLATEQIDFDVHEIAERFDLSLERAQKELDRLTAKGFVVSDLSDDGTLLYRLPSGGGRLRVDDEPYDEFNGTSRRLEK